MAVHHEGLIVGQEGVLAHAALEQPRHALRFGDRVLPGERAHHRVAPVREVDHGRDDTAAVPARDDLGRPVGVGVGDDGVGSAEVYAEDPVHAYSSLLVGGEMWTLARTTMSPNELRPRVSTVVTVARPASDRPPIAS